MLSSRYETTGQPTTGHTGELCISGPRVAVGYLGQEPLTKEKFTIYGYRIGNRVIIRGFRIELDKIEQEFLRTGDEIQSAAAIVDALTESQMRETLIGKRLPHYIVPSQLIQLNQPMPHLISGKIDRKALVAYITTIIIDLGKFIANPVEVVLCLFKIHPNLFASMLNKVHLTVS